MKLVQVYLGKNKKEGRYSGYLNYEFTITNVKNTDSGPRLTFSTPIENYRSFGNIELFVDSKEINILGKVC